MFDIGNLGGGRTDDRTERTGDDGVLLFACGAGGFGLSRVGLSRSGEKKQHKLNFFGP